MDEIQQLKENDKCYFLILNGGLGARVVQSVYIRSLINKRKLEKNNYPILVVDNSLIGAMCSQALKDQNVIGITVPEHHNPWPHHPGIWTINNASEHPMFIDAWRENFKNYTVAGHGSLFNLLNNNWSRAYSIEYGFGLTKLINQSKYKNDKKSFIGYLYGQTSGIEYDGNIPMLKRVQHDNDIEKFINQANKPIVLLHLGIDYNASDMQQAINYRVHKVWSIQRWGELVDKLKHKYIFAQISANQFNVDIPNVTSIKVKNLNPVMQILESDKCKFFMSIDNYLPHLAASIKKPGIVMWGSVSPYVWGWSKTFHKVPHYHIWNKDSCDIIACWRPNLFDVDQNGKTWVCDRNYNCMKSITVDQVMRVVNKLEDEQKHTKSERIEL